MALLITVAFVLTYILVVASPVLRALRYRNGIYSQDGEALRHMLDAVKGSEKRSYVACSSCHLDEAAEDVQVEIDTVLRSKAASGVTLVIFLPENGPVGNLMERLAKDRVVRIERLRNLPFEGFVVDDKIAEVRKTGSVRDFVRFKSPAAVENVASILEGAVIEHLDKVALHARDGSGRDQIERVQTLRTAPI